MANDTIWMRCCYCGAGLRLSRWSPSTALGDLDPDATPEQIARFLSVHFEERDTAQWQMGIDLHGTPGIEFVTDDPRTSTGQMYLGPRHLPKWDYAFPPTPAYQAHTTT